MVQVDAEQLDRRLSQTRDELREEIDRRVEATLGSINSIDPAEFERRLKEVHDDARNEYEKRLEERLEKESVVLRQKVENGIEKRWTVIGGIFAAVISISAYLGIGSIEESVKETIVADIKEQIGEETRQLSNELAKNLARIHLQTEANIKSPSEMLT